MRMTPIPAVLAVLALSLALGGCSMFGGSGKKEPSGKELQVMEFLDAGKPKAALVAADELVAQSPDDYQSYLTRNAVYLVLRDYASARADNDKALEVYQANPSRYPEKERNYRLAKVYESFALTALIASRRASDQAERERLEGDFKTYSDKVKELDEETWKNLRGLMGERVGE
ncbi:hypothetical protein [Fundidesulfovibrio terrae]|uniref:hypothetical protein n=1 Tax=Fundidesulfovibrio terrae TaxID=2922866 RepID=UPI001FAF2999|nr:hypothetical protein [Fundidesulfovibrio terrae]